MRFERLDLNLLVALDALLSHRNISRAAEELHLTQSALSNSLARLREYFEDELLVPVGRRMELTPRAESLVHPVRDVLVRIRTTIAARPVFDPAQSDRVFTLLASDYSLETLIPATIAIAMRQGSRVGLRVLPLITMPARALERGDADLLVVPDAFCSTEHPSEALLEEERVCVVWSGSRYAQRGELTLDDFVSAGHVVMEPGVMQAKTFDSIWIERAGIQRHVAVSTYSFSSMPSLVVGTEYVATVQRRLALRMLPGRPVRMFPVPVEIPRMSLIMQWHTYRTSDPATLWLRSVLREGAAELDHAPT